MHGPLSDEAIRVEGLVKRYGTLVAVNEVSFTVRKGEIFGVLGPNGAGKTTLLETIEGLLTPDAGRTLVLGMDTHQEPHKVKERIGVHLQASAYFEFLTLKEILHLFGRLYRRRLPPMELLRMVGLEEKANSTVAKLSGGQKQRFAIAAALVNDPEVLFLDEPTTGLDPQARRSLWEFIQQVHRQGRTVVLTTHYMEEAQFLCQRVAIMDRGTIVALDTPMGLVRRLEQPYVVKVVSSRPLAVEVLGRLDGVKGQVVHQNGTYHLRSADATRTLRDLLAWAQAHAVPLEHLEVTSATLEDVFLALTGRRLQD
ncbi:MAG: ABC transporter ATP-binding protein [Dehalococcoidia bacterium]|nr:ABC transporter ATP-binding protein [Dehalococcoidia bacterium]MDW8120348.1 ABC transporter ATP-binding protein [Chloroflexota bacterium]